jgi:hypothetical protein
VLSWSDWRRQQSAHTDGTGLLSDGAGVILAATMTLRLWCFRGPSLSSSPEAYQGFVTLDGMCVLGVTIRPVSTMSMLQGWCRASGPAAPRTAAAAGRTAKR